MSCARLRDARVYDSFTSAMRNPPPTTSSATAPSACVHLLIPEPCNLQVESDYELAEKARLRKQAARELSSGGGDGAASATLAQRLLQGWAMLSTICPVAGCHNPLMRDRSGIEQCVSCSGASASVSVKATAAVAADAAPRHVAAAATVPVQAAGDCAGEMETEDEEDQALLDDGAGRMYAKRRMEALLAASASSAGGATPGTGRAVRSGAERDAAVDRVRVQSQALDTLYRALDSAQQQLRVCSSSLGPFDVNESMRQADLIAKLAKATRAVSELPTAVNSGNRNVGEGEVPGSGV